MTTRQELAQGSCKALALSVYATAKRKWPRVMCWGETAAAITTRMNGFFQQSHAALDFAIYSTRVGTERRFVVAKRTNP
jgi:hypothetical protein